MNLAKATDAHTSTSSIVVSFDSKWHKLLLDGKIRAFVRRRGPTKFVPEWVYAYINSPVSALVAKLPVTHFEWRRGFDAKLCDDAALQPQEMRFYTGDANYAAFRVGSPCFARPQISLKELQATFGFVPPQSFFIVSIDGRRRLDSLGSFLNLSDKRLRMRAE